MPNHRVSNWDKDVPWTNNGTEQVIGRMKVRSKIVRGYKTESGMLAGLMLAGSGMNETAGSQFEGTRFRLRQKFANQFWDGHSCEYQLTRTRYFAILIL